MSFTLRMRSMPRKLPLTPEAYEYNTDLLNAKKNPRSKARYGLVFWANANGASNLAQCLSAIIIAVGSVITWSCTSCYRRLITVI